MPLHKVVHFNEPVKAVSFAGLVTVGFVVAAVWLHPAASEVISGAVPTLPSHHQANYFYLAVSIIGIPFAVQHAKLAILALWPFGSRAKV